MLVFQSYPETVYLEFPLNLWNDAQNGEWQKVTLPKAITEGLFPELRKNFHPFKEQNTGLENLPETTYILVHVKESWTKISLEQK